MKHKYSVITFFAIITILLISYFFIVNKYYTIPLNNLHNINKLKNIKDEYANSINSKKIIITSGSSVLYGINTKMIENNFHIPTVNSGINADLQLKYHLYRTMNLVKEGDIIILPFEYRVFNYRKKNKYKIERDFAFSFDKEYYIKEFGYKDYLQSLFNVGIFDLFSSIKIQNQYNKKDLAKVINVNGDNIQNLKKVKIQWDNPRDISTSNYLNSDGLKLLKDFKAFCDLKNATLFITYPNTIYYSEYSVGKYKKYFKDLDSTLRKEGFNVIGYPYLFMYDRKYFFNTAYHLNTEGIKMRTKQLIDLLKNNKVFMNALSN